MVSTHMNCGLLPPFPQKQGRLSNLLAKKRPALTKLRAICANVARCRQRSYNPAASQSQTVRLSLPALPKMVDKLARQRQKHQRLLLLLSQQAVPISKFNDITQALWCSTLSS